MCLFSLLVCLFAMPSFSHVEKASAETLVKFNLLPKNYNAEGPEVAEEKYGIKNENLNAYTPFDFENGIRMNGQSVRYNGGESFKFEDKEIKLERHENISLQDNLALSLWINFDNIEVHDLSISLVLEDGENLTWSFSSNKLLDLVGKTGLDEPYGWNKMCLPFAIASKSSENILNGEKLVPPSKLVLTYSSAMSGQNFARLSFYDVNIEETSDKENVSAIQQEYSFCKAHFMNEDLIPQICVGDSIVLPNEENAILYAWIGEKNIKNLAKEESSNYKWRVYVTDPNGVKTQYSFGQKITFSQNGNYAIYYSCEETSSSGTKAVLSSNVEVFANRLNAIYFGESNISFSVGATFILNISVSQKLSSHTDIIFEFDHEALDVGFMENGQVFLTAKKTGEYEVKAKTTGTRFTDETEEYETTLSVKVTKSESDRNATIKMVVLIILGCFGIGFIICLIISLVKSRKIVVK